MCASYTVAILFPDPKARSCHELARAIVKFHGPTALTYGLTKIRSLANSSPMIGHWWFTRPAGIAAA